MVSLPTGSFNPKSLTPLVGYDIGQIQLILHPIWDMEIPEAPSYLAYVQRFDIIPQPTTIPPARAAIPDPTTGQYVLKRVLCSDRSQIGNIFPLLHCHMPIQLTPRFGVKADTRLTGKNSIEWSTEFFLNTYFNKDVFQYLRNARV